MTNCKHCGKPAKDALCAICSADLMVRLALSMEEHERGRMRLRDETRLRIAQMKMKRWS